MQVFRRRWTWLLAPLVPAYALGLPVLFLAVDHVLRLLGTGGADARVLGLAVAAGTGAVLLNARRDTLRVDAEGLRLSAGDAPVDIVAAWPHLAAVRRTRRGPWTLDSLVLSQARLVRREATGWSALRGPLRERAFQRERARRQHAAPPEVPLHLYCRGGWDGAVGEVIRRHRPDLVPTPPSPAPPR